jgi:pectate lyase
MKRAARILAIAAILMLIESASRSAEADRYLRKNQEWFGSGEALQIGRNILSWQTPNGDWPKNTDTVSRPRPADAAASRGTFDNGATVGELRFLAKLITAGNNEQFREAFNKGLRLILKAQYANGGWPQSYPPGKGYARHITYNDNAFVRLATLVRDAAAGEGFAFVPPSVRQECSDAYKRAIQCVLRTQVKVDGELTVWCAQHDEKTLEPRPARTFELVSLSGAESAGLLLLLIQVEKPGLEIRRAVEAGMKWFEKAKLTGLRQMREAGERKIVRDPKAPPLWARFYEIGTNRPMFSGRDGIKRYDLEEIEAERRNGYAWYGQWGSSLDEPYRKWRMRLGIGPK